MRKDALIGLRPCIFCQSSPRVKTFPIGICADKVSCSNDSCGAYFSYWAREEWNAPWIKLTRLHEIGRLVMLELDTGGGDYMTVRHEVSRLSGIPPMAKTFQGHIAEIAKKLEGKKE